MRLFLSASIGALALAACAGHHEGHGPAGISYACDHGPVLVIYSGGGFWPRSRAEVHYGGQTVLLRATRPTYGLRFEEHRDRAGMVWAARGEEAFLSERADDLSERPIATCTRDRSVSGGHGEAPHGAEAGDRH